MEDPLAGPPVTVRLRSRQRRQGGHRIPEPGTELPDGDRLFPRERKAAGDALLAAPATSRHTSSAATRRRNSLKLEFAGGTGFDPAHDGHVHKGEIRFIAPDRIEHRWFHFVGPKEQGVTHWFLERPAGERRPRPTPDETKPDDAGGDGEPQPSS